MAKKPVPSLLTPEKVSELFSLKIRQVKELARQGKIPAIKVGKLWRFPEDSLRAWIVESQATCTSQADINSVVDEIIERVNNNDRYCQEGHVWHEEERIQSPRGSRKTEKIQELVY